MGCWKTYWLKVTGMSELPQGWGSAGFLDVLNIEGGGQPPKSTFVYEPKVGYVQLLQIRDFGSRPVPTYIPDTDNLKKCLANDVLIARYGASIGRILTGLEGAYNVAMAKVVIPDGVDRNYVRHLLQSELFQAPLRLVSRSAQNGFNKEDLAGFEVVIAPEREQTRIANQLDTLLTRVQACNDRFDAIPALLKRFRQKVLDAATFGTLTENWRESNGGDYEWKEVQLRDIADVQGGVTKDSKKQSVLDEEVPYLRVANVQRGYIDLAEVKTIRVPSAKLQGLLLADGDVLFNEGGDLDKLGRGWVWEGQIARCSFQNHVFRARLFDKRNQPKFLSWWGNSRGLEYFLRSGKQTTNLASINKTMLAALPIRLPSAPEQAEIVRRVEALFALADRIEARCTAARTQAQRLTPLVLAKAFRGDLVPQDPADESASALLARIGLSKTAVAEKSKRKVPVAPIERAQAAIEL